MLGSPDKLGMATNVVMPKMGESISEGTILRWLKKEGDAVEKDEPILEISTDKVDTEVPSPVAGTLLKILAQEKQTVNVGEPIPTIGANGEAVAAPPAAPASAKPKSQPVMASEAKQSPAPKAEVPAPTPQPAAPQAPSNDQAPGQGQAVVMPKMGESIA